MAQKPRQPDYIERLRRNLRPVLAENGFKFYKGLDTVSGRQLYRIECGDSVPTLATLQAIADEGHFDMLDLFRE